ncbi:hypothetical protein A2U01_0073531, partial [Trifolium medium]|nr:hypothetical protein [Trifolium medium]
SDHDGVGEEVMSQPPRSVDEGECDFLDQLISHLGALQGLARKVYWFLSFNRLANEGCADGLGGNDEVEV